MPKLNNLKDTQVGDLTVLERDGTDSKGHPIWKCECICGNFKSVRGYNLRSKNSKSCGCGKIRNVDRHGNWKGHGEIQGKYWSSLQRGATKKRSRPIPFEITIDYAWDLFLKQNRKCALSGLPIYFAATNALRERGGATASLDRIKSNEGYIEGNVQWVHKDVNYMKQDLDEAYFVEMCNKIGNLGKRKKRDAQQQDYRI